MRVPRIRWSSLAGALLAAVTLSGCTHSADFQLFVNNETGGDVEVRFWIQRDGHVAFNKTYNLTASSPDERGNVRLKSATYELHATTGPLNATRNANLDASIGYITVHVRADAINFTVSKR